MVVTSEGTMAVGCFWTSAADAEDGSELGDLVVSRTTGVLTDFDPVESVTPLVFTGGAAFGTGKRICESAMTISERNRARKKRLSI